MTDIATLGPDPTLSRQRAKIHAAAGRPAGLRLLFVGLVLYAAFGKGFAYASLPPVLPGMPPLYVGEMLLTVALVSAGLTMALPGNAAAIITFGLAALVAVQVMVDLIVADDKWLDTARGLAPIYYAAFAFAVYALLRRWELRTGYQATNEAIGHALLRAAPFVTLAVGTLAIMLAVSPQGIGEWPGSGGVPILMIKPGDISVTLVMLIPLLARRTEISSPQAQRLLWLLWGVASVLVVFRSRGALLAVIAGWFVLRPRPVQVVKALWLTSLLVGFLYVSGAAIQTDGREVSFRGAVDATVSMLGDPSDEELSSNFAGTKEWRTEWWAGIWSDVRSQPMLLHGHGWGDNLAHRYGIGLQRDLDDPLVLRLPHSIFFSLAGRAGLLAAVAFLTVPAATLARSFRRERRAMPVDMARGGVVAIVVTALADIYLESPQGAILFWSLVGFLWWTSAPRLDEGALVP